MLHGGKTRGVSGNCCRRTQPKNITNTGALAAIRVSAWSCVRFVRARLPGELHFTRNHTADILLFAIAK
jgi:hypothetical protein